MTLDAVAPRPRRDLPVASDLGQYDPWAAIPEPGQPNQPVVAEAHYAISLQEADGSIIFTSNTPLRVQLFTSAYSTSREEGGAARLTGWHMQATRDVTSGFVQPIDYSTYLSLPGTWGVMVIAVLTAPDGTDVATGDPDAAPSDDMLRVFVLLADMA